MSPLSPDPGTRSASAAAAFFPRKRIVVGLAAWLAVTLPALPADEAIRQWAASVDPAAMAEAFSQIESLTTQNDESRAEFHTALLSRWAQCDLSGALAWFGKRSVADDLHQQARDTLAQAMAQRDPAEMLALMKKSLPISARRELCLPFFQQLAMRDPALASAVLDQAVGAAQKDPVASARVDLTGQIAAQWANADLPAAIAWARSLPDGPARLHAFAQISDRWTETNPREAAAFCTTQGIERMFGKVAAKWAETDPSAAGAWALELPEGEGRDSAIVHLVTAWSQSAPRGAAAYASHLPAGFTRDQAMLAVLTVWAEHSPSDATRWTGQFSDNALRQKAAQILARMANPADPPSDQPGAPIE